MRFRWVRSTCERRLPHRARLDGRGPGASDALWRAQTQRAVENFPISGTPIEPALIHAIGEVKAAAAKVNGELGILDSEPAAAIEDAARAVAAGEHDDAFPIDVFQTGSGTSSNMNANEVIASLAARAGVEVHPNDHVNASQSSNDTFPTAIHVAASRAVTGDLLPAIDVLATSLEAKATEFAGLVKSGRTHLMDATPVMLGQEFSGYAATVRYAAERLESVLPRVRELPLGGTAVGTGINTPAGFPEQVIAALSESTGEPFTEARNHFEAQGTRDSLVELSGVLKTYAVGLTKICNDLRWMSSGPTTGLAEIHLPDLQPGSSIMPGKVNPVLPEATLMVCAQVDRQRRGRDRRRGQRRVRAQRRDAGDRPQRPRVGPAPRRQLPPAGRALRRRHHRGHRPDAPVRRVLTVGGHPANKYVGYEAAAKIAKQALADGATIRETVIKLGYVERGELTEEQLDQALDVESMTHP